MKQIDSGYGNSGDMIGVRERAWQQKSFRYVVISTSGGHPGAIGGSFNYHVYGTNSIRDLFKSEDVRSSGDVIDTKLGKTVAKSALAKQYLKTLSKKEKDALLNKTLVRALTDE